MGNLTNRLLAHGSLPLFRELTLDMLMQLSHLPRLIIEDWSDSISGNAFCSRVN